MPKLKDWLKDVAAKGNIQDANFETVLAASALNEIDVPDTFVNLFNTNFFTKDRALNDPSIVAELAKKSNKSAFDTFDQKMAGFLSYVAPEDAEAIKNTRETYEKYDLLKAALEKAKKSTSGKINEDANKILEEKTKEIKSLKDGYEQQLKDLADKLNNEHVNGILKGKILAYNLADPFKPLKESIAEIKISNLRQKYVPVSDKGEIKLMTKTPDGQLVEAYDGNEKLTVDKFIEKDMKDFIAVSNGAPKDKSQPTPVVITDQNNATLAEIRRAAVPSLQN